MPESDTSTKQSKPIFPHQLPHPKKGGRPVNPKPKHFQVARDILNGKPMGKALLDAGYAEASAHNPSLVISSTPSLVAAIQAELGHYQFAPEKRARVIRQRLLKTVLTGNDANANRACELAGKDKEVRLFEADTQINILNCQMPGSLLAVLQDEELETVKQSALEADCT